MNKQTTFKKEALTKTMKTIRGHILTNSIWYEFTKLDHEAYQVLSHIVIKDQNNREVKIDYIIVSDFGVFVINRKKKKGLIYGYETNYRWTQNNHGRIKKFFNPLFQNQRRIHCVRTLLKDFSGIAYYAISVFPNQAELYVDTIFDANLIHVNQLSSKIKTYKIKHITTIEKEKIISTLQDYHLEYKESKKTYINRLINTNRKKTLELQIDKL